MDPELNARLDSVERSLAEIQSTLKDSIAAKGEVGRIADSAEKAVEVAQTAVNKASPDWKKTGVSVAGTVISAWIIAQCGIGPAAKSVDAAGAKIAQANDGVAKATQALAHSVAPESGGVVLVLPDGGLSFIRRSRRDPEMPFALQPRFRFDWQPEYESVANAKPEDGGL